MTTPPELIAFVAGYPLLLAHLGIALAGFVLWSAIYTVTSRGQEISQIREGNPASPIVYGATLLALALPLGHAVSGSSGLVDIGIWVAVSGLVQLTLFGVVDLILAGLTARIRDDADTSGALLLGCARLAVAWLFASALKG